MRSAGYNAGVWDWNSDDDLCHHNEVTGGHGTLDSTAYDIDCGNTMSAHGVVPLVSSAPGRRCQLPPGGRAARPLRRRGCSRSG
ncbi:MULTISPECIES: hypothetical protein [Streptomyces]|jgi:hypothetical protein|uniref:hypothetical protein n=1 Tax=unclassified Streptomyces TaxID=2593676 RepID=UPI00088ECCE6|nr:MULTISPECIES: hypothetical protein [unclassified Streptomyces]MDX2732006.1 hypothetical protein [Streptomyces sp. PA03-2a]MDX3768892.1 hypothetical protein [Streptomyces sp. AK08-01B]MDX3815384.1 hypothetical protein [Streptomyces sp. AK08-01A]SCX92017.1 hypothetical protein SAMN02745898_101267 [Streptomyces sp. 136MFCol5.1]